MEFPKLSNLHTPITLGSSGSTKQYINSGGRKWIVKKGSAVAGFEQAVSEGIANDIYRAVGIPVPKQKLYTVVHSLVLEHIEG